MIITWRFQRRCQYSSQFITLIYQILNNVIINNFPKNFQPVQGLICFFSGDLQFRYELCFRTRTAGSPVVRSYWRRWSYNLFWKNICWCRLLQRINEPYDLNSELFSTLFQFFRIHFPPWIFPYLLQPKICNLQSTFVNLIWVTSGSWTHDLQGHNLAF